MNDIKEHDNIAFFTETFRFDIADNLDDILAPLYITEENAAKEISPKLKSAGTYICIKQ